MKNETDTLNEMIIVMENKRSMQLQLLKEQVHAAYESIKPITLIKNTFHEVTSSPEIKNNIVSNAIGMGTGFLSKKLLVGSSHNPLKRLLGTLIQFAVANVVSKHADGIKSTGENLLQGFLKYRTKPKKEFHNNGNDLFI